MLILQGTESGGGLLPDAGEVDRGYPHSDMTPDSGSMPLGSPVGFGRADDLVEDVCSFLCLTSHPRLDTWQKGVRKCHGNSGSSLV